MMKNAIVTGMFLILVLVGQFVQAKAKDVVGTWNYEAPSAPYEYSKGKLIFMENGEKVEGKIKIGTYEIEMKNVKVEGDQVSFGSYVEGEYITIKIKIKNKSFDGTASYSEGTIEVKGEKE
jgi:hypothetical protein